MAMLLNLNRDSFCSFAHIFTFTRFYLFLPFNVFLGFSSAVAVDIPENNFFSIHRIQSNYLNFFCSFIQQGKKQNKWKGNQKNVIFCSFFFSQEPHLHTLWNREVKNIDNLVHVLTLMIRYGSSKLESFQVQGVRIQLTIRQTQIKKKIRDKCNNRF